MKTHLMWYPPWRTFCMNDKKTKGKSMLEKIMTAIKVESKFLTEVVLDSAGVRKFEQEIEDAKYNLKEAKSALTDEMSNELQTSRRVKILADKINQQESLIVDALSQNNEKLAFNLATVLVELEQDYEGQLAIQQSHDLHLGHLKRQMEHAERFLKDLERQLAMVNTTERIQQATAVITKNFDQADAKMLSAKKSLDRIRKQQLQMDEHYSVESQLSDSGKNTDILNNRELECNQSDLNKLRQSAEDVLKRIEDKE